MDYYDDYDDFPINHKKLSSGAKTNKKDKKNTGNSCYNSKHIRVQEAKKQNSNSKKPTQTY